MSGPSEPNFFTFHEEHSSMTMESSSSGGEGSSVSSTPRSPSTSSNQSISLATLPEGFVFDDLPHVNEGETKFEYLVSSNGRAIPLNVVSGLLRMATQAIFGYLKDFGTISCVCTQSFDRHTASFTRSEFEKKNQIIVCGYGHAHIPSKEKKDGVCRHNRKAMEILAITRVDEDPRTIDSVYAKEGGLRSYIGMRLDALPECTICILFVGEHAKEEHIVQGAAILKSVVTQLNDNAKMLIDHYHKHVEMKTAHEVNVRTQNSLLYVAHEIRNQLVPWAFFLQDVQGGEQREMMESTLSTVNDILSRILTVGKSIDVAKNAVLSYFNLERALAATDSYASQILQDMPGVRYERTISVDPHLMILGHEHNLKQCIMNLMSNARKFTKSGTITLSGSVIYDDSKTNAMITLVLTDTGVGVPADKVDTVLKPFGQVDAASAVKGTGLGLHLCQVMVELLHKGRMTFESEEGKGTSVSMKFPLKYKFDG